MNNKQGSILDCTCNEYLFFRSNVQCSLWIIFHSAQMLTTSGSFNKNKQFTHNVWIHSLCQVNTGCWCSIINEWQPPSHPEPTRIISNKVSELIIKILWKSFCFNFDFNYPIMSQFCAKLWPDWIITFLSTRNIFSQDLDYSLIKYLWNMLRAHL